MVALLRWVAWACYLQPAFLRRFEGACLGFLLKLADFRGRVVRQNLEFAYPRDPGLRQRLFSEFYSSLGNLALEILLLFGPMARFARTEGVLEGKSNWERGIAGGKGVIFLTSHLGNWEAMAAIGAAHGIATMMVTKHLKPEWLHQAIEKGRKACGVDATYEPRTFRDVLARLKKNGTVGIVLDQYAGPPVGVRVPFFGTMVGTHAVIATLAKRTGAAVVPVLCYRRREDLKMVVEIQPALDWIADPEPNREIALNTARYTTVLEEHIRRHPSQWLWIHRRFKGELAPLDAGEWETGRRRS